MVLFFILVLCKVSPIHNSLLAMAWEFYYYTMWLTFTRFLSPYTPRLCYMSQKSGRISYKGIIVKDACLNEGTPWWNCGTDPWNGGDWNIHWFSLGWAGSWGRGTNEEVFRTWSFVSWGWGGGFFGALEATSARSWTTEWVTLKAVIGDEFDGGFKGGEFESDTSDREMETCSKVEGDMDF